MLRKCLYYRSINMGCKELDIILGNFANKYVKSMNYEELIMYADILSVNDRELYNYISGIVKNISLSNLKMVDSIVNFVKYEMNSNNE